MEYIAGDDGGQGRERRIIYSPPLTMRQRINYHALVTWVCELEYSLLDVLPVVWAGDYFQQWFDLCQSGWR